MKIKFKNAALAENAFKQAKNLGYGCKLVNEELQFESLEGMEDFMADINMEEFELDGSVDTTFKLKEGFSDWKKLSGIRDEFTLAKGTPTVHAIKEFLENFESEEVIEEGFAFNNIALTKTLTTEQYQDTFSSAKADYLSHLAEGFDAGVAIYKAANENGIYPRELQNWLSANGLVEGIDSGIDTVMRKVLRVVESTSQRHPDVSRSQILENVLTHKSLQNSVTAENVDNWLKDTRNIDINAWLKV